MKRESKKQDVRSLKVLGSRRAVSRRAAARGLTMRSVVVTAFYAMSHVVLAQTLPAVNPAATLPAGHPVMSATTLPAAGGATMPAGHPSLDQLALPTSMPPASMPAGATLPAGHPPMGTMGNAGGSLAVPGVVLPGDASNLKGTLNISVIGASANGSPTANEGVTVELYNQGNPVKRTEYKTDGLGKLTVNDIPLMPPMDVVVSIHHAGLLQQAEAPQLTLASPLQSVEMKVFDPTEEQPAWNVAMQHMIVEWAKDGSGAVVTEMLSTSNPADRAWTGAKVPGMGGTAEKRVTLILPLPAGADQIQLGGSFDEDDTRIVEGKLVTGSPLFPGRSEFRLTYKVPARSGAMELPIVAPAAVGNLIVFVPADDTQITATGVSGGKVMNMGQGGPAVRMYTAQGVAAGAVANLSITGIKAAPVEAAADETPAGGSAMSQRNLVVGGAFLLVLAGAALMLMKKPAAAKE